MVLSGLVYAGLWVFAPTPVAIIGIALAVGYRLAPRDKAVAVQGWPADPGREVFMKSAVSR